MLDIYLVGGYKVAFSFVTCKTKVDNMSTKLLIGHPSLQIPIIDLLWQNHEITSIHQKRSSPKIQHGCSLSFLPYSHFLTFYHQNQETTQFQNRLLNRRLTTNLLTNLRSKT